MNREETVSIIIPALNEEDVIGRCLESIKQLNVPAGVTTETIVVDNGSRDRTVRIARSFGAEVIVDPYGRISALRNQGARFSRGRILAFLDADCRVHPDWLANALQALRQEGPQVGAVGSHYRVTDKASWVARAWAVNNVKSYLTCAVSYIPSGNCIVRREVFERVRGFNETLSVSEDTEFCLRLSRAGYMVCSHTDIVAYHTGAAATLGEFYRKQRWHGGDILRLLRMTGFDRRYLKAFLYAAAFFILGVCALGGFCAGRNTFAATCVAMGAFVSLGPALRTVLAKHEMRYLGALWVLYFVYGAARASCLVTPRTWKGLIS